MPTPNLHEIWQIEVGGEIYEAAFGELGDWIGEGSLQPDDNVRKGNLRWTEARLVPGLVPFFNAKEKGLQMPVFVNTTNAAAPVTLPEPAAVADHVLPENPLAPMQADPVEHSIALPSEPVHHDPTFCAVHTDIPTVFLCDGCGTGFCKVCPKAYGGSVRICPFCGAMCRTKTELLQKNSEVVHRTTAIDKGFGASDFFNALGHPFRYKTSLFFGAIMFMIFTLGQSVSAMGGMYMMVSGIFCVMLANMLTFGVLANTIENFSQGNLDANFMPTFDDFELWDSIIHPFFLSIGAYASSFGPFILVLIIGFYMVVTSVSSQMDAFQQKVEKIPGTHYYDATRTVNQSEDVKDVLGAVSNRQAARVEEMQDLAAGSNTGGESVSDRETREQEELWAMAQQSRKESLEGVLGKSPETEAKENEAMMQGFLNLAAPLVVIGAICFLWGVFYFPAACLVAGFTRSFGATINPLVGLDTIKRLGGTYVKILIMGLALIIASTIVGSIAGAILAPFDLPGMGNLPAKAIGALFGFYLFTVFACVLGYALFKKGDKLAIHS